MSLFSFLFQNRPKDQTQILVSRLGHLAPPATAFSETSPQKVVRIEKKSYENLEYFQDHTSQLSSADKWWVVNLTDVCPFRRVPYVFITQRIYQ